MSLCNQVMKNLYCFVHVECLSIQWNSNFAPHFLQHLYIIYISLEKYKKKSQEGRKWVDDALKTPCIWNEWTNKSEKYGIWHNLRNIQSSPEINLMERSLRNMFLGVWNNILLSMRQIQLVWDIILGKELTQIALHDVHYMYYQMESRKNMKK